MENNGHTYNNTGWIIAGVAIGTGIALTAVATKKRNRWRDRLIGTAENVARRREELAETGKNIVDRIRIIYEESRKVIEETGELWEHGRRLVRW